MARPDVLVFAGGAERNLNTANTVFVDVDTTAYDTGHIPVAVKLDWRTDLQDPVKRDFLDAAGFSELLSDRGIANDDTGIIYGGNNNWFAADAYWYFKLYGHRKVKPLDGSRKKWELDDPPLSAAKVARPATSYTAQQPDDSIRAFRDEVINAINVKNPVDVRSPTSSPAKSGRRRTCLKGRASGRVTYQVRSTYRGAGLPTRTAPSNPMRHWPSCMPTPAWTGDHRLLPDRRTFLAHLVRAARAARTAKRQELRRQLDGIRCPGGRPDRVGKLKCALDPNKDWPYRPTSTWRRRR